MVKMQLTIPCSFDKIAKERNSALELDRMAAWLAEEEAMIEREARE